MLCCRRAAAGGGRHVLVAVTGASGGIGRWVVQELRAAGHPVLPLDRRAASASGRGPTPPEDVRILDIEDAPAVIAALEGVDAIVHLAAIPGHRTPEWTVFDPNLATTYHVLEAVRAHGIGRLVMASSIWAYGYNPPAETRLPRLVPLSEEFTHPTLNGYGLSKRLLEHAGAECAAVTGCQVVCMRFPWVVHPHRYPGAGATWTQDDGDLSLRAELWSYVDVRDVAAACRLALEKDGLGFEALNIGAADTRSAVPSETLVRRYLPGTELVRPVAGREALYSIERARAVLGYAPVHGWRPERAPEQV
jgi:nucleoside-diphosphate-sugar epimerase